MKIFIRYLSVVMIIAGALAVVGSVEPNPEVSIFTIIATAFSGFVSIYMGWHLFNVASQMVDTASRDRGR